MKRIKYTSTGPVFASIGYSAATTLSRTDRVSATNASGDYHTEQSRKTLVSQSRDFYRNNALYKGIIDRCAAYIIGEGFTLQCRTTDTAWNKQAESLWREWWKRPEVRGLVAGTRLESLICREWLIAGDVAALKLKQGTVQIIEAEQIDSRGAFSNGVEVDDLGKPIAFNICPYGKYGQVQTTKPARRSAADVLFVVDPERPSSVRGVPACQSAFPMLHRINDMLDSEAVAWQMLSKLAFAVMRAAGPDRAFAESVDENDDGGVAERITELEQGIIYHGLPGEEVKGIDRNIPGQNFSESLRMFLRIMGLPLGIPLEVALLDWTGSNYSQSRAVLEQAFQTFSQRQSTLEDLFYTPLYQWKVGQWQTAGLLPANTEASRIEWIKPSWPWIDQLKEVEAQGAKLDRGITTLSSVCKALHTEREDIITARAAEITDAIAKASEIEAATGVSVPWQIFAGLKADEPVAVPNMPESANVAE